MGFWGRTWNVHISSGKRFVVFNGIGKFSISQESNYKNNISNYLETTIFNKNELVLKELLKIENSMISSWLLFDCIKNKKYVLDLKASASSPYHKNQIIETLFQTCLKRKKIGNNKISSWLLFDCIKNKNFSVAFDSFKLHFFAKMWSREKAMEFWGRTWNVFLPEKHVSDLMVSASSPYHKNQIIKKNIPNYFETTIFYKNFEEIENNMISS